MRMCYIASQTKYIKFKVSLTKALQNLNVDSANALEHLAESCLDKFFLGETCLDSCLDIAAVKIATVNMFGQVFLGETGLDKFLG